MITPLDDEDTDDLDDTEDTDDPDDTEDMDDTDDPEDPEEWVEINTKIDLSQIELGNPIDITFSDDDLYETIKEKLEANDDYQIISSDDDNNTIKLYEGILNSITTIILENKQFEDISGIEQFSHLEYLDLMGNQVDNAQLESINQIETLKVLELSQNKLTQGLNISKLTNLEEIYASNNQITNIEGLSYLANLKIISLANNQIKDMSPIANLANLKELYLDGNQIEEIYDINGIEKISLQNQQITRYVVGGREEKITLELPKIFTQSNTEDNEFWQLGCEEIATDKKTIIVNPYTVANLEDGAMVMIYSSNEETSSIIEGTTLIIKGVSYEYYISPDEIDDEADNEIDNEIDEEEDNEIDEEDNIDYTVADPTEKTNRDIIVGIISTNSEIEKQEYTFNSNGTHTFFITVNGEEKELETYVNFIDKSEIGYEIKYSTTRPTNDEVTVYIIADRELVDNYYEEEPIEGSNEYVKITVDWDYFYNEETGKTTLKKTFSENTSGTIILEDMLGNEKEVSYDISNITDTIVTNSIIAKEENAEGEDYVEYTWTNKNIYIEKKEDDLKKGEQRILSYIDEDDNETIVENNTTLKESGIYLIVSKTIETNDNIVQESMLVCIDKEKPTLGTLETKLNTKDGAQYEDGTTTNQNVYVSVTQGEDSLSGVAKTTFIVNEKDEYDDFIILQTTGTYKIVVKTIDNAGNTSISDPYTIVIDKRNVDFNIEYIKNLNNTVTAKITSSKKIQSVLGWDLSEDGYTLTKTYTNNQQEKILIKDLYGNTSTVTINITDIETEELIVFIAYSSTAVSSNDVTVTLTANRPIKQLNGWSLDNSKLKLRKTYSQNTKETVTITDELGYTTDVKIEINNIIKTECKYTLTEDGYVLGISPETSLSEFKTNLGYQSEIEDTDIIKTGMKVKISNNTYTVIVTGDSNGDGMLDIIDLVRMKRKLVELENYDIEFVKAMDINSDGELDITDIAKAKKIIVGLK